MQLSFKGFNFDELTPRNLLHIHQDNVLARDRTLDVILFKQPLDVDHYDRKRAELTAICDASWAAYEQFSKANSPRYRPMLFL